MTKDKSSEIQSRESIIKSSDSEKLPGIKMIQNVIFDDHFEDICTNANRKLGALVPATP